LVFVFDRDVWESSHGALAREQEKEELFSAKGERPAVLFPPPRREAWIEQVWSLGDPFGYDVIL
jgi:hypothetical protein